MRHCKVLSMGVLSTVVILSMACTAQAASKISKKSLTLSAGKSTTLSLKKNKKKVKWSTSKKSVVTIKKISNNKVKLTARKPGSAKITAKVGKKKYTCKVTVKPATKKANKTSTKTTKKNTGKTTKKTPTAIPSDLRPEKYHYVIGMGESVDVKILGSLDGIETSFSSDITQGFRVIADMTHPSNNVFHFTGTKYGSRSFRIKYRTSDHKKSKVSQLITLYCVPSKTKGLNTFSAFDGSLRVNSFKTECPIGGGHNLLYVQNTALSDGGANRLSGIPQVICSKCGQTEPFATAKAEGVSYTTIDVDSPCPFQDPSFTESARGHMTIGGHMEYEKAFYIDWDSATNYMNKYMAWVQAQ